VGQAAAATTALGDIARCHQCFVGVWHSG